MNEEYENKAADVASKGRYGDSMILHVNPLEVAAIDQMYPGMITRNPDTGQPEAFAFLLPLLAAVGKGALGAAAFAGKGLLGAASTIGSGLAAVPATIAKGLGSLAGTFGAGSAPAAGVTTAGSLPAGAGVLAPGATTASGLGSGLGAAGSGIVPGGMGGVASLSPGAGVLSPAAGLAPGGGVLAPAFGGGKTVAQVASQLNITPAQVVANPQMAIDALANPAIGNKIAAKFANMQGGGIGSAKDIVANPDRYLASTDPATLIEAAQPLDNASLESLRQGGGMGTPAQAATVNPSMMGGIQNTLSSAGEVLKDSVLDPIGDGIGSLATAAKNNPIPSLLVGYGAIDAISNAASGDGGREYDVESYFDREGNESAPSWRMNGGTRDLSLATLRDPEKAPRYYPNRRVG